MSKTTNNALCYIKDEIINKVSYIEQTISVKYNNTMVYYTITRDLTDGFNISDVEKHFDNNPYLEDNKICYDEDLSVLSIIFSKSDEIYYIDQYLYDMDISSSKNMDITLLGYEDYSTKKVNVTFTLLENRLFYE